MYSMDEHGNVYPIVNSPKKLHKLGEDFVDKISNVYIAPTLELVSKWLREEKDFDIESHREGDKYILYYFWFDKRINGYNVETIDTDSGYCVQFSTREEALLKEGIENSSVGLEFKGVAYEYTKGLVDKVAEKGWNSIADINISIAYNKNNGFYTLNNSLEA